MNDEKAYVVESDIYKIMAKIDTPAQSKGNKKYSRSWPPEHHATPVDNAIREEARLVSYLRDERIKQIDPGPQFPGATEYKAGDPGKTFDDLLIKAYKAAGMADGDQSAAVLVDRVKEAARKHFDKVMPLPGQQK